MADLAAAALAWTRTAPGQELTTRQIAMLALVCDEPNLREVRHLAGALHVAKPVITRAANTMQALGLVQRVKLPEDKRCCAIIPTAAGTALRCEMRTLG